MTSTNIIMSIFQFPTWFNIFYFSVLFSWKTTSFPTTHSSETYFLHTHTSRTSFFIIYETIRSYLRALESFHFQSYAFRKCTMMLYQIVFLWHATDAYRSHIEWVFIVPWFIALNKFEKNQRMIFPRYPRGKLSRERHCAPNSNLRCVRFRYSKVSCEKTLFFC